MEQWVIYKHTSMKSGKSYIGQTKRTMEVRWKEHLLDASADRYHSHFHRAIRLYGEVNWKHEILVDCIDMHDEANALENYYIKKYDTFENGYNLTGGGSNYVSSTLDDDIGVITLTHEFLPSITGTISEIASNTSLHITNIKKVARYERIHTCGYTLDTTPNKGLVYLQDVPLIFKHLDGTVFKGTAIELKCKYNLTSIMNLDKIRKGKRKSMYGWHLVESVKDSIQVARTCSKKKLANAKI